MGNWIKTGEMILSGTGKSFRIFQIIDYNRKICIGLIPRKAVSALLRGEIWVGEICQYVDKPTAQPAAQEQLGFEIRAADPSKLGAAQQ